MASYYNWYHHTVFTLGWDMFSLITLNMYVSLRKSFTLSGSRSVRSMRGRRSKGKEKPKGASRSKRQAWGERTKRDRKRGERNAYNDAMVFLVFNLDAKIVIGQVPLPPSPIALRALSSHLALRARTPPLLPLWTPASQASLFHEFG